MACWKGYEQFGMKTKNGKRVPNCIPVKKAKTGGANYMGKSIKAEYAGQTLSNPSSLTYYKELLK